MTTTAMTYYDPIVYTVSADEVDWRLDTVLRSRLMLSRKLVSRLKMTEQGILVNGARQYTSYKVQLGDRIEIRMKEEESDDILPEPLPLDIIYEDEYLLIVNKEAGRIVHPTQGHYTQTLANAVVYHWQQRGMRFRFRPIHRLDRDTSGVLAIAKNPYIHQQLSEQLQRNEVEKKYLALVHGNVAKEAGTIDAPIDRDPLSPHVRIVTPSGYPSITHYELKRQLSKAALLQVKLETGRTHQIRVHMKHLGHPLLGDDMYGDEALDLTALGYIPGRQALHAASLCFQHPMSKQYMMFEAPLPSDMQEWIERLT